MASTLFILDRDDTVDGDNLWRLAWPHFDSH